MLTSQHGGRALKPGPMHHVVHNFFSSKSEVFAVLGTLDLWPTTYVSDLACARYQSRR